MKPAITKLLKKANKASFPEKVAPMLATLTRHPFNHENYVHEIKFDGYRIIAHIKKGKVKLASRSGLDYTSKYSTIVKACKKLKADVVLDGEVCALNDSGRPDFDTLQKPMEDTKLVYYAFDILWLNGFNLKHIELTVRKKILELLLGKNKTLVYSAHFDNANELFEEISALGMEGIVSKRKDSEYREGQRGNDWLKTPTEMRQEFVVGGWTESSSGRPFASLLFGAYRGKNLEWIGHAGGGFKEREMPGMLKTLKKLEIKKSPFTNTVEASGKPHWVKPQLVANFKFATYTKSGRIRKPAIFLGFRSDKKAKDVVREKVISKSELLDKSEKPLRLKNKSSRSKSTGE